MVPADEAWSWFSFELQTFSSVKYLMKMLHKIGFIDPKLIQIVTGLNRWGVSTCLRMCICVWECVFMCLTCYQTGFSLVCLCVLHWELFTHLGSLKYKIPGLFLKFWIWNISVSRATKEEEKKGWMREGERERFLQQWYDLKRRTALFRGLSSPNIMMFFLPLLFKLWSVFMLKCST